MIRKRIFISIMLLIIGLQSWSQHKPYQIQWKLEIPMTAIIGSLGFTGQYVQWNSDPFTPYQLSILDPVKVPAIDAIALDSWRPKAGKVSDVLAITAVALPYSLALLHPNLRNREDILTIGFIGFQAMLSQHALMAFTKPYARRTRPYVYIQNRPGDIALQEARLSRDARFSFFSGHTSSATTGSFLAAKMFSDYFPDSPAKPYVWGAAILLPAVVGYLRVRAGKHFPTDVIVGYLVGASIGILIPHLHLKS